jgi:hypothetical protein
MMYCINFHLNIFSLFYSKYKKINLYNGFMKRFSCISNTFTHLSTPIEDSILLKKVVILLDKYEVSI